MNSQKWELEREREREIEKEKGRRTEGKREGVRERKAIDEKFA